MGLGLLLSACGPSYQSSVVVGKKTEQNGNPVLESEQKNGNSAPTPAEGIYQKPLTPTYSFGPGLDLPENIKTAFDPMPTQIKTKTAIVHLGQTHFQNVQYLYDFKNKKIKITGHLQILDLQGKTKFTEKDFELIGIQNAVSPVVLLQSVTNPAQDAKTDAAVIKAKVTCLGVYDADDGSDDDQISCDKAVVDFFVSYNKQYLTDQFETKSETIKKQNPTTDSKPHAEGFSQNSPLPKKSNATPQDSSKGEGVYNEVTGGTTSGDATITPKPVAPSKPPVPQTPAPNQSAKAQGSDHKDDSTDDDNDDEVEGSDGSINSRYQGQVENTDVVALFKDDQGDKVDKNNKISAAKDKKPELQVDQNKYDKKSHGSSQDSSRVENKPVIENKPAKIISVNIEQTEDGKLRPYNQAVGYPDDGRLRNATNLKEQQASQKEQGLYVILSSKQRYYATFEMSEFISRLAKFLTVEEATRLSVGNISAQKGGHISPHQSHQIGMDADFGYPTVQSRTSFPVVARAGTINKSAYSVERTFESFKFAFKQNYAPVEKIFVDQLIINDLCHYAKSKNEFSGKDAQIVKTLFQNIQHVDGHGNHFHVRLKCTSSQPACRSKQYRRVNNCAG